MSRLDNVLLVDLGNSSIKWGKSIGGKLKGVEAAAYRDTGLISVLEEHWIMQPPSEVWVSAVAEGVHMEALSRWVKSHWGCNCAFMHTESYSCGVECAYQEPAALGVDRWAAIIAGYQLNPNGFCVVDCGTAITLDAVNSYGRHLGGYILPGFDLMKTALLENTAIRDYPDPDKVGEWGSSTPSSIYLGSRKAVVALIENALERLQAEGVCDPALLITGSAGKEVASRIQIDCELRADMVLEGLLAYAEDKSP